MSETVGEKIKRFRLSKKLSTYDLARKTGLSQSVISKLENGNRRADVGTLEIIAKGLDIKTIDLVDTMSTKDDEHANSAYEVGPSITEALKKAADKDPKIESLLKSTLVNEPDVRLMDFIKESVVSYVSMDKKNSEDVEDWTEEERLEIENFKKYIRSKRNQE